MSAEVFALIGVITGSSASYLGTTLHERSKWKRQISTRWDEKRLEAYSNFAEAIDAYVSVAERMGADRGIFGFAQPMGQAAGFESLGQANAARSHAFEPLLLMGDADTISAARALQRSVWKLADILRDANTNDDDWKNAYQTYQEERDRFYMAARSSLGVSAKFRPRSADPVAWHNPAP